MNADDIFVEERKEVSKRHENLRSSYGSDVPPLFALVGHGRLSIA